MRLPILLGPLYTSFLVAAIGLLAATSQACAQSPAPRACQVENKASGYVLRPYEADSKEGTPIVVHERETWKCMTWDLVLTIEGEGVNARVVLKKWTNAPSQCWKLLPKPEKFTA